MLEDTKSLDAAQLCTINKSLLLNQTIKAVKVLPWLSIGLVFIQRWSKEMTKIFPIYVNWTATHVTPYQLGTDHVLDLMTDHVLCG